MRWVVVVLSAVVLTSCSNRENQGVADAAPQQMIGRSRADVLTCAGAPLSRGTEGDVEVWTYSSAQGGNTVGVPVGRIFVASQQNEACTVNMVFQNGAVSSVRYANVSGSLFNPQHVCGRILNACMAR